MKKNRFYFVLILVIVVLSMIGILLGMILVNIEENNPEYLSAGLFKATVIFFVALLITVFFHEMAHIAAFKLQGIGIRLIYIFPLFFVKERECMKFNLKFNINFGFGGIVIPEIPLINSGREYEKFRKKLQISLACGPITSIVIGILSFFIVVHTTKYIKDNLCSYYFLFFSAMFLWSLFVNLTSFLDFGGIVGDYVAIKKIQNNKVYFLVQIYNFLLLQDSEKKDLLRKKYTYFMERMCEEVRKIYLDINSNSMNLLLIDSVLYEKLIGKYNDRKEQKYLNSEVLEEIMVNISERIQFELYFQFFSHGIMYIYMMENEEKARELWEKYKNNIPCTRVGMYRKSQVELLINKKYIEEFEAERKINTSSLDTFLSGIDNYYEDEIYLNSIIIKRNKE